MRRSRLSVVLTNAMRGKPVQPIAPKGEIEHPEFSEDSKESKKDSPIIDELPWKDKS